MVIRKATPQDAAVIAKVHVDSWRTTYKGIVPDNYLEQLSYERRGAMWTHVITNQPENPVFVAEDDDRGVVGFANGGKERSGNPSYQAELYALYIFKEFQGSGIGRALISSVVSQLKENGYNNMMTWVAKDNRSLGFYEHVGGKRFGEKVDEIDGTPLCAYAMGWDDLSEWN